jgi:hypothetical protein
MRKKSRQSRSGTRSTRESPAEHAGEVIGFNDAVREAKQILAQFESGQMRLGELADRVEPAYGQGTIKKFAKAIGIAQCTLERYRDVYRAWKDISAPGRESLCYAVMRELAAHPGRAQIVSNHPSITRREASEEMRAYRQQNGESRRPTADDENDVSKPTWAGRRLLVANKAAGDARVEDWTRFPLDGGVLQAVREAAEAWRRLLEHLEQQSLSQAA